MAGKYLSTEQILTILDGTAPRIAALTAGLESTQLHSAPAPGEWSLNDVLAHLRACLDVWGGHILVMIAQDRPAIQGINPRTWIKKTDYLEQEFRPSLQAFTAQRGDLLASLKTLPPEGWLRKAVVAAWGQVYEPTVLHYADGMARHERTHVRQIAGIVKTLRP